MSSLISRLNNLSSANRLNTVEAAFAGSPGAQANFKATWQGYDEAGRATVKANGRTYAVNAIGIVGLPVNSPVTLRVGKSIKIATW